MAYLRIVTSLQRTIPSALVSQECSSNLTPSSPPCSPGNISATEGAAKELTHEQFLKVFSEGSGFTSGCGIEYSESAVVRSPQSSSPITGSDYLNGILRPGRRLLDSVVRRYADANIRHLQDGKCRLFKFSLNLS